MSSSAPPDVAALVERFFRRRGEGRRVSVDDVLAEAGTDHDGRTRFALIEGISRRIRSSSAPGVVTTIALEPCSAAVTPAAEAALLEISGYDLIEEIGRGGMGVVYEAYQQSTGRRVGVKLLSEQIARSEAARRRFEREVELVARLQHPNIVSVLDSGIHQGRYFYVMEYVQGSTLDEHFRNVERSKSQKVETKQALRLVAKICDAVEYAHQRGVLHRDLKPTNILVAEVGAVSDRDAGAIARPSRSETAPTGEPKILDFGLAKDIDPLAVERRALTLAGPGQILGTLAYMAPEQARGAHEETSVRSDVYSLGAIAYEAVTGRLPCATDGALHEVLDRIQRQDPPRPSSVIRDIPADVDAILLKALDKSPERRYATAGELAADLRRWLSDEPILARRVGAIGRVGRWVRRNRSVSAVSGLAAALLVSGTLIAFHRISAERDRARAAATRSEKVTTFLLRMMGSVNPGIAKHRDVTMLEVVNDAAGGIESQFAGEPGVEAAVRQVLGAAYLGLAQYDKAEAHVRRVLEIQKALMGPNSPDVAAGLQTLGHVFRERGQYAEAEELLRESLRMRSALLGERHSDSIAGLGALGSIRADRADLEEAELLLRQALSLAQSGGGPEEVLTAELMQKLGGVLRAKGAYAEARRLLETSLAIGNKTLGEDHPNLGAIYRDLGFVLFDQADYAAAESAWRSALALARRAHGDSHPHVSSLLVSLGHVRRAVGDFGEAESLYRQAVKAQTDLAGPGHPEVMAARSYLADVLLDRFQFDEAEQLLRELALNPGSSSENRMFVGRSLCKLADAAQGRRDFERAESLLAESLRVTREVYGEEHGNVSAVLFRQAMLRNAKGDYAGAEPLLRDCLAMTRRTIGETNPDVAAQINGLAICLRNLGRLDEAESLFRESLHLSGELFGSQPAHPGVGMVMSNLGSLLAVKGEYHESEAMLREAERLLANALGEDSPAVARARQALGEVLLRTQRAEAGAVKACEAVETLRTKLPAAASDLMDAERVLAECLVALARFAEAEWLLLQICEVFNNPRTPAHKTESALNSLIELYDAWHGAEPDKGYDAKAMEWRAKLAEWQASSSSMTTSSATSPGPLRSCASSRPGATAARPRK